MIDDEYFLDDDDLNADSELDVADKEILVVTDAMEELLNKIRENIKFGERSEFEKNSRILSTYINGMLELSSLSTSNASAAEKMEAISRIDSSVRNLDYTDLVLEDVPTDNTTGFDLLNEKDSSGDDFDF